MKRVKFYNSYYNIKVFHALPLNSNAVPGFPQQMSVLPLNYSMHQKMGFSHYCNLRNVSCFKEIRILLFWFHQVESYTDMVVHLKQKCKLKKAKQHKYCLLHHYSIQL